MQKKSFSQKLGLEKKTKAISLYSSAHSSQDEVAILNAVQGRESSTVRYQINKSWRYSPHVIPVYLIFSALKGEGNIQL